MKDQKQILLENIFEDVKTAKIAKDEWNKFLETIETLHTMNDTEQLSIEQINKFSSELNKLSSKYKELLIVIDTKLNYAKQKFKCDIDKQYIIDTYFDMASVLGF